MTNVVISGVRFFDIEDDNPPLPVWYAEVSYPLENDVEFRRHLTSHVLSGITPQKPCYVSLEVYRSDTDSLVTLPLCVTEMLWAISAQSWQVEDIVIRLFDDHDNPRIFVEVGENPS